MKTVYSPMDKETVVEKIKNGNVKVKNAAQKPKVEKPKTEQAKAKPALEREKLEFSEAQIIAAVKAIGHAATSREISDKLGIKDVDQGRGYVRSRMAALVKSKKIVTSKPEDKSRATFLYSVA
jgi:hypothetical protein